MAADIGTALAKGAARRHAWKRWRLELGGLDEAQVAKVKAHGSRAECVAEAERWAREGNAEADAQAKEGAGIWGR